MRPVYSEETWALPDLFPRLAGINPSDASHGRRRLHENVFKTADRCRWHRPPGIPALHGVGGFRRGVDDRRRRAVFPVAGRRRTTRDGFHFVQISDSHIGFNKPANADVNATLQIAIGKINALPKTPDFLIHTGDLTHTAKPAEFDTLANCCKARKPSRSSTFPANTITPATTARNIWRASAKVPREPAGTVSTTTACISWAW